ncbi:MAG: histidine phosphatase family protein [Gammaproteobacteria bacterium]|nr:histidine phosphatase family protein [Gammaproteobacteria bacterium]
MPHNITNILLVRHGQTEWNQQQRIQGHQNSALTDLGKQQAERVKHALDKFDIDQAYVSPLKRARDTIQIILKNRQLEASVLNDLKEIKLGPWEGKTRQETALSHPDEHYKFWHTPDTFTLAGAETYQQLQQRMVGCLEFIFSQASNNNILVVSHWIAIKVALAFYQGTPLSQLSTIDNPDNGSFLWLSKQGENISISQAAEI